MKTITSLFFISLFAVSLVLLGGCSKKPVPPYSSQNANGAKGKNAGDGAGNGQGTITEETTPGEESLDAGGENGEGLSGFSGNGDQNSEEYKKTYGRSSVEMQPIYFDFDQSGIRNDQASKLEHNANYMSSNPSRNMVVEGNCDERGTNEYNLALGERRAQNAKNYLVELGVEEYRIRTLSFGEERPLFTGQTEFDWSQNRRDDFILE